VSISCLDDWGCATDDVVSLQHGAVRPFEAVLSHAEHHPLVLRSRGGVNLLSRVCLQWLDRTGGSDAFWQFYNAESVSVSLCIGTLTLPLDAPRWVSGIARNQYPGVSSSIQ
jgi:hypothetical protein